MIKFIKRIVFKIKFYFFGANITEAFLYKWYVEDDKCPKVMPGSDPLWKKINASLKKK